MNKNKNMNNFKMIKIILFLNSKIIKTVKHSKECRDQQKYRIKQINVLESESISSFKDHPKSFFYKKF